MSTQPLSTEIGTESCRRGILQEFILARLAALQKTQKWFALEIDLDPPALNGWSRGKIGYSADWIKDRALRFAEVLQCDESEIMDRIDSTVRRWQDRSRNFPLSKGILAALFEDPNPTDTILEMLQRVEDEVGLPLNVEVSRELIKLVREAQNNLSR
jgi:hypothetical protein